MTTHRLRMGALRAPALFLLSGLAAGNPTLAASMRQVAPTVAQLLNVHLPSATQAPLPIHQ